MCKIKLSNVLKYYGDRKILNIDNLEVNENEKIGIVGKNGSGKTTLLKIIAGDIDLDKGKVEVIGSISFIKQLDNIEENKVNILSGGEKILDIINEKISNDSNILLADEPSTNLDIFNIDYVIKRLQEYKGIVLLISHDRNVLDQICTSIIEIEGGEVKKYKGNYSSYKKQKELENERKKFEYKNYIKEKEKLERAVIKSREGAKTMKKAPKRMGNSEARLHKREASEIKEKLEGQSKALKTRIEKLEVKQKPKGDYSIYLKPPTNEILKNKIVIKSDNLNLEIGEKTLIKDSKLYIYTNKINGLIGKNGSGKTTLIKQIVKCNKDIYINPSLEISYFRQNLDNLNPEKSILENVMKDSIQSQTTVRNILGNLNIKDDDIYKLVKDLSGGEKVKISLAKVILSDANFLILDEPTNFLDIQSIEGLEKMLKAYKGTVLLVSHDKKFLDDVVDNIIIIKNKKIIQYDGNYSKYLDEIQDKNKKRSESKNKNNFINKEYTRNTNDKLLLEFQITKLESEIAVTSDKDEKERLIKLLNDISNNYQKM